jgi:hypothetical protein
LSRSLEATTGAQNVAVPTVLSTAPVALSKMRKLLLWTDITLSAPTAPPRSGGTIT